MGGWDAAGSGVQELSSLFIEPSQPHGTISGLTVQEWGGVQQAVECRGRWDAAVS